MEVTWTKDGVERTDVLSQHSLSVEQLIYLAGFFDGEGSVGLYSEPSGRARARAWKARITITQKRSRHVDRLFALWVSVFAGSISIKDEGRVAEFVVRKRASCAAFVQYVGPYCAGKRRQIVTLGNWIADRQYSYRTAQTLKALKDIDYGRPRHKRTIP